MRKLLNTVGLFFAFVALGIGAVVENFGWLTLAQMFMCAGIAICCVTAADRMQKDREDHLQPQED